MVKEFDLIMYVIKRNKIDRKVEEAATQQKVASTRVMARGGTHEIATILTDMYSPTFKPDFEQWLRSIPDYPEAFAFKLGSIVDLLNFRANDLLSEENVDWGCEGHNLLAEELADGSVRWYYLENSTRRYCPFADRNALDDALHRRRLSLQIAIDIHMSREVNTVQRRIISYF